jgi:hypothetical protein
LIADDAEKIGANGSAIGIVGVFGAKELKKTLLDDIFGVGDGSGEAIGEAE